MLWILLILISSLLTVSTLVPQIIGYIFVIIIYIIFISNIIVTNRFTVIYHRIVLLLICIIWMVFLITTILDPNIGAVLRLGSFILITGINLFVIPAVIDRSIFHDALAYMAGGVALIGLPTAFLGSYGIGGLVISPWHTNYEIFGSIVNTPVSVFANPNYLAGFAAIGAVAAGAKYARSNSLFALGLLGINILTVILSNGRAALLSLIVVGFLYIIYYIYGRTTMAAFVGVGIIAGLIGFAMVLHIIPGPSTITQIHLGDRRTLWTAIYKATVDRPLLGWGPGNDQKILAEYIIDPSIVNATHNSYLRMFLISGIVGGGAYLILSASIVIISLRNINSKSIFTFLLFIVFLIIQLFEGGTIFGLSLISTSGALFMGYLQSLDDESTITIQYRQDTYSLDKLNKI